MSAILLVLVAALAVPGAAPGAAPAAASDGRAEAIRLARQELSRELGVEPETLAVGDVTPREWNDSSLGCPEKGMRYLPVLTPGFAVELTHQGRSHLLHVGSGRAVSCKGGAARPAAEKREQNLLVVRLLAEARKDLARRLGVAEPDVKVTGLRKTTWPDAGLGCAAPGERHEPAPTDGYAIELQVGAARYAYHTDSERTVYCPRKR